MNKQPRTFVALAFSLTVLAAASTHANLIVNGDFEAGNTGFDTDYVLDNTVASVATYTVAGVVPNGWASGFGDHTSGAGLMAIFNASSNTDDRVWAQEVDLVAGATYDLTFWVAVLTESIRPGTSPWLAVGFDGVKPGFHTVRTAGLDDVWQEINHTFVAAATGPLTLLMRERRGIASGDDFALDDISLVRRDLAVPAPGGIYLLLVGLVFLLAKRRRYGRPVNDPTA